VGIELDDTAPQPSYRALSGTAESLQAIDEVVRAGISEVEDYRRIDVLALYFGAVQVKVLRHSLAACIVADFAGPLGAFLACKLFFSAAPYITPK